MNKNLLKNLFVLIAYTIGLLLLVLNFKTVLDILCYLFDILWPLFMGIAIAFICNRPAKFFFRLYTKYLKLSVRLSKALAILTVYLLAIALLVLYCVMIIPELNANIRYFIYHFKDNITLMENHVNGFFESLNLGGVDFSEIINTAVQFFQNFGSTINDLVANAIDITSSAVVAVINFFIAIIISIYILFDKDHLLNQVRRLYHAACPKKYQEKYKEVYHIVIEVFANYIDGQCIEAIILGLLCFICMRILNLEYDALISSVIALTALIPILGAYLGGGIGAILLVFISPVKMVVFLIFLIILQQIETNLIYPKVVGTKIGLPGLWVLVGVTFGGSLLGVLGMLVAVPITTIIYRLLKLWLERREAKTGVHNV